MKSLLICPSHRTAVSLLAETQPLAAVPLLGQGVVEYWLTHLACSGGKEVWILADDRPEQIQALVGNGARWGLKIHLIEESRELTAAQALLKYEKEFGLGAPTDVTAVLDHLPGFPDTPLFESYSGWFSALQTWMPRAKTPDRVGVLETDLGVWVGLHCHVSPDATLRAPCWLGKNVYIGVGATIGPGAVIEDGAFIESGSVITNSLVGPDTFVGQFSEIENSLAWGDTLVNLQSSSITRVPDRFVMCYLRNPRTAPTASWLDRVSELCSRNKAEAHLLWKHFLMNKEG